MKLHNENTPHLQRLPYIRIKSMTIDNYKGVGHGKIDFYCAKHFVKYNTKSDILGIYGQNGSGKTAFIEALSILQYAMAGQSIPDTYLDCIPKDPGYSSFSCTFDIQYPDGTIKAATYTFSLKTREQLFNETIPARAVSNQTSNYPNAHVFDEALYLAELDSNLKIIKKRQQIFDASSAAIPFGPASKQKEYYDDNPATVTSLLVNKQLARDRGQSFIFMNEFMATLTGENEICPITNSSEYVELIQDLKLFALLYFFVIDNRTDRLRLNYVLPIHSNAGILFINTNQNNEIPVKDYTFLQNTIDEINIVLEQLVKGTRLVVISKGNTLNQQGEECVSFEIMSQKNGIQIPLRVESDGIQKIVSILVLITAAYNYSVTVAIDELDAGVFEYLLVNILSEFKEHGKGQLIFTSHNLHPLEAIEKESARFTTANPQNRYISIKNVAKSNSLRKLYYEQIEDNKNIQDEVLYEYVAPQSVALALHEAGVRYAPLYLTNTGNNK